MSLDYAQSILFLQKGENVDAKDHDLSGRGAYMKYLRLGGRISMAELIRRAILHYLKARPKPPVNHISLPRKG
jgi:hypothetical protein